MRFSGGMHYPYLEDDDTLITTNKSGKCLSSYFHFKLYNNQTWQDGRPASSGVHCGDIDFIITISCTKRSRFYLSIPRSYIRQCWKDGSPKLTDVTWQTLVTLFLIL